MNLRIDPEFKALIPPLTDKELEQLEQNILTDGIRDALVAWNGILLDGHNRLAIAQKHNLGYATTEIDLPERDAALLWVIKNQLGRRNLTPQQMSYLRGKRYEREKLTRAEAGAIGGLSKDQNDPCLSTATRIAAETGVSAPTIKRDAKYACAIDKIAEVIGPEARDAGVEPRFREWNGVGSLVAFVVSMNLKRRHLDSSQRAAIAVDILPMLEAEAKERQRLSQGRGKKGSQKVDYLKLEEGKSTQQAAKMFNTNRQYISDAKKLKCEAPELFEQVRVGKLTIPHTDVAERFNMPLILVWAIDLAGRTDAQCSQSTPAAPGSPGRPVLSRRGDGIPH